jgi:L-alanine-DL-glutamate epimerase-like enolase superfamily enzyme
MVAFSRLLAEKWATFEAWGHPLEIGVRFQEDVLEPLINSFNCDRSTTLQMPYLAALIACSAFDIALHDAYGQLHGVPTYATYGREFFDADLSEFLKADPDAGEPFLGKRPSDFLVRKAPPTLPVWHLVGGLDPLEADELTGAEPDDGYPVLLSDWIERDELKCLKIKLRGNDATWDYDRMVRVGQIARSKDARWLSADFNCTVNEPAYVNEVLDRLATDEPEIFNMILYVEQPFPYDLEAYRIDVRSVAKRKPLFMDESAHDWRLVRLGRSLGWTGVALKTCKTQTGALLSLCWARAHGMALMVQDLSNPMLAQIPHVLLAAHAETIMGVESNGMQFYPAASAPEARVHSGLYARRGGALDLSTLAGPGFGYRIDEIARLLPEPTVVYGNVAT